MVHLTARQKNRTVTYVAAMIILLLGLLALMGSLLEIRLLVPTVSYLPAITNASSIGLILLGIGLVALPAENRFLIRIISLLLIALAVFLLLRHSVLTLSAGSITWPRATAWTLSASFFLAAMLLFLNRSWAGKKPNLYSTIIFLFSVSPLMTLAVVVFNPSGLVPTQSAPLIPAYSVICFLLFLTGLLFSTQSEGLPGLATRQDRSSIRFRKSSFYVVLIIFVTGFFLSQLEQAGIIKNQLGEAIFSTGVSLAVLFILAHATLQEHKWQKKLLEEKKQIDHLESQIVEILEISEDGILLIDKDRKILYANSGAEKIFGWTRRELLGKTIEDRVPVRSRKLHPALAHQFLDSTSQAMHYRLRNSVMALTKDGMEKPVAISLNKKNSAKDTFVVVVVRDLTSLENEVNRLKVKASVDTLTGVYNRNEFERIARIFDKKHFRRGNDYFGIMMVDVDHFKKINDEYGHEVGDRVLVNFANTIRRNLRDTDRFFRYGGEEFVVMSMNITREDALAMAERIRTAVKTAPTHVNGRDIYVTCSIGIFITGNVRSGLHQYTERADRAMYEAKKSGRDQIIIREDEVV